MRQLPQLEIGLCNGVAIYVKAPFVIGVVWQSFGPPTGGS